MAILSTTERERVWRGVMRYWSKVRETIPIDNVDLRSAIDATDQWIEDNQLSYNNVLPEPAKSNLTLAQKTLLFCVVAAMRVSESFARKLIGGMD